MSYGPETQAILRALKTLIGPEYQKIYNVPEWVLEKFGTIYYELYPKKEDSFRFLADGAIHPLQIPFPHQWKMIYMTHRTSADVLTSSDKLAYNLRFRSWKEINMVDQYLWGFTDVFDPRPTVSCPPNWVYPSMHYELDWTSGDVTDFIYPVIVVERLGY